MDEPKLERHDHFDGPFYRHADSKPRGDWEDWEDDDDPISARDAGDDPLIESPTGHSSNPQTRTTRIPQSRLAAVRQSTYKFSKLKSRRRQKAQNAKAGIKLETDMSKFCREHIAFQIKPGFEAMEPRRGRFVDAAALKALEGEPSTATAGSFSLFRRKPSQASKGKSTMPKTVRTPVEPDLSPDDRPIVIGFALPEGACPTISPQTAIVGTPVEFPALTTTAPLPQQQRSVWSPDTDDGHSIFRSSAVSSSLCSRPSIGSRQGNVPPVPALPSTLKGRRRTTIIADDDDAGTPITLFEEDTSPVMARKSPIADGVTQSPTTTGRRSQGWWDELISPFAPPTPFTTSPDAEHADHSRTSDRWEGAHEKEPVVPSRTVRDPSPVATREVSRRQETSEIIAGGSPPTIAPSSHVEQDISEREHQPEKAQALVDEPQHPSEEPPPYSPPSTQQTVRYRAVFPPGHPLNTLYPPSPGPMSPGLTRAMTSQGAITMTDVPLTPPPGGTTMNLGDRQLPDRPLGSFVPGDHFLEVSGRGAREKAERQRRRHEKEDAVARKVGGLWKGRGCLPANGCHGRPGREGRKRRRICFGIVAGVIALIILVVAPAVTLTRPRAAHPVEGTQWLNLTTFPPMPTGVLTVVGPDNSQSVTACIQPSTLWSCSLPKEQADEAAPYRPTQPKFIFQIQFDNSSNQLWNVTGQTPPRVGRGTASRSRASLRRASQRSDPNFKPNPAAPSFEEMWFLGNTTDGIQSDQKAGEPTPFYISLLKSINETAGPDVLDRRGDYNVSNFPTPDLNTDGTGAPARLFPLPVQQPLRLYDRGLPSEHYGFYSYYDKSIYVKSKSALDETTAGQGEVPADLNGGALETEANFVTVWGQTRFKVEIWTRIDDTSRLVGGGAQREADGAARPGTFPYPVTVTLDNHGGNPKRKGVVWYPVDDRQRVRTSGLSDANVILYNLKFNGEQINGPKSPDPSLGGFDGGTGGCKCEYTNFVTQNGQ